MVTRRLERKRQKRKAKKLALEAVDINKVGMGIKFTSRN